MDFQTLARRELQSLCKLNKIPANLTNVAMAEALQSLHTVVGIEEYLNGTQSETADVLSPKARSTVARTTRRGSKQPVDDGSLLNTPAVSRTTRKVNVSHRLSECETEVSKYTTRRSTRLTEKKATVRNGAVKIDSILDQGNSSAEVEDICNAFEKLDVVVIEEEVVNNVKQDSDEASVMISEVVSDHKSVEEEAEDCDEDTLKKNNSEVEDEVCDMKPESEDENLVQKVEFGDDLQEHNHPENDTSNNVSLESGVDAELELEDTSCAADSEMINETNDDSSTGMIIENQIDEIIITKEMEEEMSENTVGDMTEEEVGDLFTSNSMTPIKKATPFKSMAVEVEDQRLEVFTDDENNNDKSDADSGLVQNQVMGNTGHVTPFKGVVSDDKENNNNVVEVKDIKKDENDKIKKNANEMSMRQLKKLLKAMTLDSNNSKEEGDAAVGTKRTALQAVCENQMVVSGGDNEN